ncbi:hypothetical protein VP01_139g1 [Puccinia sorghi]|uniref:Uncharacterized protein n=1 Tax=Puccinia sorghi TaxID=27349 RepID=A0A0L6VMV7_9BASI|nr:hypothetical protein VP01_139g1 [Puccinia sorghi]
MEGVTELKDQNVCLHLIRECQALIAAFGSKLSLNFYTFSNCGIISSLCTFVDSPVSNLLSQSKQIATSGTPQAAPHLPFRLEPPGQLLTSPLARSRQELTPSQPGPTPPLLAASATPPPCLGLAPPPLASPAAPELPLPSKLPGIEFKSTIDIIYYPATLLSTLGPESLQGSVHLWLPVTPVPHNLLQFPFPEMCFETLKEYLDYANLAPLKLVVLTACLPWYGLLASDLANQSTQLQPAHPWTAPICTVICNISCRCSHYQEEESPQMRSEEESEGGEAEEFIAKPLDPQEIKHFQLLESGLSSQPTQLQHAHPWTAPLPAVICNIYCQCANYQEEDSPQVRSEEEGGVESDTEGVIANPLNIIEIKHRQYI